MKHIIHTPTADFAYVETEIEITEGNQKMAGQMLESHNNLLTIVRGGDGLDNKSFIALLDELWTKHSIAGDPGVISDMSKSQQEIVRAFKLCITRNK